ncbi:amino-acid N-acetyltransferase [Sideroxydans lithotrophicus]|uniref:Amino-acid acetyltransferase n=1 Tax=Sideroxydans lithotrophicus (strain ES-1) TaxID=580332 RepID=D5CQF2_SIDLE|nr:amino-acid N-acetyltransferase [Sideroxydans lithotrophicus]ADE13173.1 amino-acid N-acetyltransferase [Sideroxydans lithotrophicus ES-1]
MPAAPASSTPEFVAWFRSVAPYINAFRGKTFVVAFGGEVVADGKFIELTHDFNLLAALGIRLVLVHGARPQIEQRLVQNNIEGSYHRGIRLTDAETMQCVKEAVGRVRVEIEALLSLGLANSPMANADIRVAGGNFITAQPMGVINGVDLMHTGCVRKVDVAALRDRMEFGEVVLLSPLGYSPTGEVFNLTLEDVATATAIALDADKLIFLTDTDGVHNKDGELLKELTIVEASKLLSGKRKLPDDVGLFLPCAVRACEAGVARTHLVSRHTDGALLQELFSDEGIGTMVVESTLNTLREATIKDVGGILQLLQPLEAEGILVRRSRELLEREIARFVVLEHGHRIIGCAALYPFADEKAGELACLAVQPAYRDHGYGDILLKHIAKRAQEMKLQKLFVLTTRTAHWFIERGFKEVDVEQLPAQKKTLYNYQRRSKVFVRNLR